MEESPLPAKYVEKPDAESLVVQNGPRVYRCAVCEIFVKRSVKPTKGKIMKVKKETGSCLYSTGNTWTGPSGGRWMELDQASGEAGWALIYGPGFGLKGPALLDASDDAILSVQVFLLGSMDSGSEMQGVIWESLVRREATVGEVKASMAREVGLKPYCCVLSKDKPCLNGIPGSNGQRLPVDYMPELKDHKVMGDCGFEGGTAILLLVYVGDMPPDVPIQRKPLPKLRDARESRQRESQQLAVS
uniref:Uncharacterized protein n=1 Tax=Alexandrium monilatum TaxID=311494 RepID=A0A7S4RAP8_9DINO